MAATLRKLKSLAGGSASITEANSSYLLGSLDIAEYNAQRTYDKGNRIYRKNDVTGETEVLVATSRTTGAFDATKWQKDGLLETVASAMASVTAIAQKRSALEAHSGFVNKVSAIGISTKPQTLVFNDSEEVHINGNIVTLPNGTEITLPEEPLQGVREDLVFLEHWVVDKQVGDPIYTNGNVDSTVERLAAVPETVLEWRLRAVAGAQFDNDQAFSANITEGLGQQAKVTAQGGNTTPLADDGQLGTIARFWSFFDRQSSVNVGKHNIAAQDRGVYVAGDGSNLAKEQLKTADGYVYGIPLLRVKRRNKGGYRSNNLNGAIPFHTLTPKATVAYTFVNGVSESITIEPTEGTALVDVGNEYTRPGSKFVVTGKTTTTVTGVVIEEGKNEASSWRSGLTNQVVSDRPDGSFSNLIVAYDILDDLRHVVSLSVYDYNYLRSKAFDQFMRGETTPEVLGKQRFGLTPAPIGLKPTLESAPVKTKDGQFRNFVNLLGNARYSTHGAKKGFLKEYTSGYEGLKFTFDSSKYYLVGLKAEDVVLNTTLLEYWDTSFQARVKLVDGVKNGMNFAKISALQGDRILVVGNYDGAVQEATVTELYLYEVSKDIHDKIGVDPEYTGDKLAEKFAFVESYPNIVSNIFGGTIQPGKFGADGETTTADSGKNQLRTSDYIPVKGSAQYTIWSNRSDATFTIIEYNSDKEYIPGARSGNLFTTSSDAAFIRFVATITDISVKSDDLKVMVTPGDIRHFVYVPYGTWFVPVDYSAGNLPVRIDEYMGSDQRKIYSEAQISESLVEVVDPTLKSLKKYVTVTNSVAGKWSIGDTVKIKSAKGIITGIFDNDTSLTTMTRPGDNTNVIYVADTSKLTVGDTFVLVRPDFTTSVLTNVAITAVYADSVQVDGQIGVDFPIGTLLMETTTLTSAPSAVATGLAGTWTGLGTKEVTFTVTTAPTTATDAIKIAYTVNYPSGKGLNHVPTNALAVRINNEKLTKVTNGILSVVADFSDKPNGSNDTNPHNALVGQAPEVITDNVTWLAPDVDFFNKLGEKDGRLATHSTMTNGNRAQVRFDFNIVDMLTYKLGEGFYADCVTLADKVAKVKSLVTNTKITWNGIGSNAAGNKATVAVGTKNDETYSWATIGTTENSKVAPVTATFMLNNPYIADNGVISFLAYAEATNGVVASTISTDSIEVELIIPISEPGYDIFVPSIKTPILVDDYRTFTEGEQILPGFQTGRWTIASAAVINSDTKFTSGAVEDTATFEFISKGIQFYTLSFPTAVTAKQSVKVICLGKDKNEIKAFTMTTGAKAMSFVTDPNTAAIRVVFAVTETSVSFEKPMLTPGLKEYSFTPYARTVKRSRTIDYKAKVAGSTFENPHRVLTNVGNFVSVPNPNMFAVNTSAATFEALAGTDGVMFTTTTNTESNKAYQVFELDLSHLDIPVNFLRAYLNGTKVKWTGFGVGSTNGATVSVFRNGAWVAIGNTPEDMTPTTIEGTIQANDITDDLKVYVMVTSKYPAVAGGTSEIHTDYVGMSLKLFSRVDFSKSNVVKVRKETKEVKLQYPKKTYRTGQEDVVEVYYTHKPVSEKLSTTEEVVILAESDGFMVSDLGSAVGHKQGKHHYMNPLYRVGYDRIDTFGEFGFGTVPFATDSKGVNVGSVIQIADYGFAGLYTTQYGISPFKKPLVGIASFLVSHQDEIKLLIISRYSSTGNLKLGADTSDLVAMLVPIEGRPLVKGVTGTRRTTLADPNAWKTPNGEIQGYLNDKGEIIATYQ